jgi:hypothetical protein
MNKKIFCTVIVSVLALVVTGCGGYAAAPAQDMDVYELPAEEVVYVESEDAIAPGEPGLGAGNYAAVERLIIRNASLDLVVKDTEDALDEINDLVDELGGWIVESSTYQYGEGTRASVTLRIPAEKLDAALEQIHGLAIEVQRENISGQDVTEEYVDLQSRLGHLEAVEEELLGFLEDAEDTEAAMAVFERLQMIQAEIEQVKGRIQYLQESAAMATISLDITPEVLAQPVQVKGWDPGGTFQNATRILVNVLQFLVDAAIVIGVVVVPALAVIAAPLVVLFFAVRGIIRWRRARKVKQA